MMIVALIAIFYFFMIRPQQRKQKEIRKFREGLNVGDRVITAGGIYGKIRAVKENTITLEIADNVRISIDKGSVYPSAAQAQESANDSAK
ncbi:preprotein translocase subunit YajC [uncultured Muribaculum sp.]|uniref:preprotein translocase subunit YajC n=1 Tax=uncultured Muribaculum sp. TaxID=1918613 RepID=UPI0025B6CE4A|nr:preprotein translocase subunit YajC [uncultured Muribaculum sp.]